MLSIRIVIESMNETPAALCPPRAATPGLGPPAGTGRQAAGRPAGTAAHTHHPHTRTQMLMVYLGVSRLFFLFLLLLLGSLPREN